MKMPKISLKNITASFRTRSFRVGGYSVVAAVIVLAIAIVINLLAGALPASLTQIDTTSSRLFSITAQTEHIVSALETEVTVYWICQSGEELSLLESMLRRYEDLSDKLTVVKKDPDVYPTFAQQYTSDTVSNNSLVVESGGRYRYIDYYDIIVYDTEDYYSTGEYTTSFDGESALTSAIDYVTSDDLPKLYLLSGHGEATMSDTFSGAVAKENIETAQLSLLTLEAVPEDADCVMIYAPDSDISEEEKSLLEAYLAGGGKLMVITDPPAEGTLTNLEALMAGYGVTAREGIVIEGDSSNYAWGTAYYLLPNYTDHDITLPLIENDYYVMLPVAQGLTVSEELPEGVSVTQLLNTSEEAYSKVAGYDLTTYEKEEGDIDGSFALAVLITDAIDGETQSDIIWVSSSSLLDDTTNTQVSGGNQDLFLNMLSYLCEPEESNLTIHAKAITNDTLTMDSATVSAITILVVAAIPLGYLACGIMIHIRRKRR